MNTFWNSKHEEAVTVLNADIPVEGKVVIKGRPALEAWRRISNAYYSAYNDGGMNWGHRRHDFHAAVSFLNRVRSASEEAIYCPTKSEIFDYSGSLDPVGRVALEKIADQVFVLALAEKITAS